MEGNTRSDSLASRLDALAVISATSEEPSEMSKEAVTRDAERWPF